MKAFCLALDKRKEHWLELGKKANELGIEFEPFVVGDGETLPREEYDYIDDPNPDLRYWDYGNPKFKKHHYNAFITHHHIINRVKAQGLEHFLMLEDDAYFTDRYKDVLTKISEKYPHTGFDILYMGWWIGDENDEWNKGVEERYKTTGDVCMMKAHRLGGLHGAVISSSMYDYILSLSPIDPIDSQLNRVHSRIESYVVLPKIIHTKTMFSNCEGSVITRNVL